MLSGNLEAGYSLENAIEKTYRMLEDTRKMFPIMCKELFRIVNGMACGQSVDVLFLDFGSRTGISEILDFAKLLQFSKHFGGNLNRVIRQTASNFADTAMVELEIDTLISAKKLEGHIMLAVPLFILLYLRVINPEYISGLYSMGGHVVMTICLIVLGVAAVWIEKIIRIEV